jgi:adenylosuccinate synthase
MRTGGITSLAVTKLDILSQLDPIRVCVSYELDGQRVDTVPADTDAYQRCVPVYRDFPGWSEDLSRAQSLSDLPKNARAYLDAMAEMVSLPIGWVSVGPGREQTIQLRDAFA